MCDHACHHNPVVTTPSSQSQHQIPTLVSYLRCDNSGSDKSDNSSKVGIKDVKKANKRVLHLYNSFIKLFDIVFCLSYYVFFYL